jgi:hypothetical protein
MRVFDSLWSASSRWISDKVGSVYSTIKDSAGDIMKNLPKTINQWASGQYHAPGGYSYCGPGTKLDSAGRPINKADKACMAHDYEYEALAKNKHKITQEDFNRMIRESDQKLVDSIDRSGQSDLGALMSKWGIKGKMALEDLGILPREKFVT